MNPVSKALTSLLPEVPDMLKKRYLILQAVQLEGPIGRRALGELVKLTERDVRKETDLLRDQELLSAASAGMVISTKGEQVLELLKDTVHEWSGLSDMETKLASLLGISKVIIIPQDSDEMPAVKSQIGREAARFLERQFPFYKRIAVTGGSTIAAIAEEVRAERTDPELQFIAARGGLGEDVHHHANTIASSFAKRTGGICKTLYLPDHLSAEAYDTMMREPSIQEMNRLYNSAEVVVHGIGDAEEMAGRRRSTEEEVQLIRSGGAVGEAFGYYFDESGNAVYRIRTVGIQLEQLQKVPVILAVAGGSSKAKAILSYLKHAPEQTVLITDEGAVARIRDILTI